MGGAHNIIFSSAAAPTLSANRAFTTFPVNFLVVAGGGGGDGNAGIVCQRGTSAGGGGGVVYGQTNFIYCANYTITVGGGGAGAVSCVSGATKGADTIVIGSGILLTANGGGSVGPSGFFASGSFPCTAGGSGSGVNGPPASLALQPTVPQTINGGSYTNLGYTGAMTGCYCVSGGGGGAGGAGGTPTLQTAGLGYNWPFTTTPTSYPLGFYANGGTGRVGGNIGPSTVVLGTGRGGSSRGYPAPGQPNSGQPGALGVVSFAIANSVYGGSGPTNSFVTAPPLTPGSKVFTYSTGGTPGFGPSSTTPNIFTNVIFPYTIAGNTTTGVGATGLSSGPFLTGSGGTGSLTYYISSTAQLPPGLSIISSNSMIVGTATAASSNLVTISVRDSLGAVASTSANVKFQLIGTSYTINYLIVAGGGSGSGGGGGGGGFISGSTSITNGLWYSITVGAGGQGCASGNVTSFNSLTASGGGYGSGTFSGLKGCTGGSAGGNGGANDCSPATFPGALALGSPGVGVAGTQGYPGGNSFLNIFAGSGGGGAGGAGGNVGPGSRGGNGGAGKLWPYTGLYYAGGGGGGGCISNGTGGTGGGGTAGNPATNNGTNGLGGGGAVSCVSGNGGSGTVIIAVPTPRYPGVVAPGATVSTPASAPGYTVLTYTTPNPASPASFTFAA